MKKLIKIVTFCLSFLFLTSCLTTMEVTRRVHYPSHGHVHHPLPKKQVIEWVYHKDGYPHCYVNNHRAPDFRCSALPKPAIKHPNYAPHWVYHNDGYAHCHVGNDTVKKSRCSHLPRPPHKVTNPGRWVYHNDGYAHCHIGDDVVRQTRCSHLPRPPRIEWVYHNDGFAHCYVGDRLAKKHECSVVPRPPRKSALG